MPTTQPDTSPPGVCLLTPANFTGDILADRIGPALSHRSSDVIILTSMTRKTVKPHLLGDLRALAGCHGKVFLVENDIGLAQELDAEGVLLAEIEEIGLARKTLGGMSMVGVVCGHSRHRAMEAGEAGADFIGLGGLGAGPDNRLKMTEHIAWWSSIFEIPSLALDIENSNDAEAFAAAGADFLALGDPFWSQNAMIGMLDAARAGASEK